MARRRSRILIDLLDELLIAHLSQTVARKQCVAQNSVQSLFKSGPNATRTLSAVEVRPNLGSSLAANCNREAKFGKFLSKLSHRLRAGSEFAFRVGGSWASLAAELLGRVWPAGSLRQSLARMRETASDNKDNNNNITSIWGPKAALNRSKGRPKAQRRHTQSVSGPVRARVQKEESKGRVQKEYQNKAERREAEAQKQRQREKEFDGCAGELGWASFLLCCNLQEREREKQRQV